MGTAEWWDGSGWVPTWHRIGATFDAQSGLYTYAFDPGESGSARVYARAKDTAGVLARTATHVVHYS